METQAQTDVQTSPTIAKDFETRLGKTDHAALRLWLRLLTCTQIIEKRVRNHLRTDFATTLPRFDLMAQIAKVPNGMRMSELSARMMVTGGNITMIVDQLGSENLVERIAVEGDKRATKIALTPLGHRQFALMAHDHEGWIIDAFEGLNTKESAQLHALLAKVKSNLK